MSTLPTFISRFVGDVQKGTSQSIFSAKKRFVIPLSYLKLFYIVHSSFHEQSEASNRLLLFNVEKLELAHTILQTGRV